MNELVFAYAGAKALRALFSQDLSAFLSIPVLIPFIVLATTSHMIMLTVHHDENGLLHGL